MIPELGQFALILALSIAIVQVIVPLIGAQKNNVPMMRMAQYTSLMQCALVIFSFAVLAYAFLTNDFSVAYVAANSNTKLPWFYRLCAVWGAHEGSLLLWVLILSFWTAAVALFSKSLPLSMRARVLAVMAVIAVGFYAFLLFTSDPFGRLLPNFPLNGVDLNPILQDPGMIAHPPMLYMGYVGFSVAFAFAIAALLNGKLDATWARWTRSWTLLAWSFLTFGIVLGSWWSYRELGWGGWWFWDPVENASFLPWLVGTALIHCLAVVEKRGVFKAWTVLLAVSAFSLSLLGTFLVRSGVLISVHAFAQDPERGRYLLEFLMFVVGASLLLYAIRGRKLVAATGQFSMLSRETMLLLNNMLLFVAMLTILLGTVYPLIIAELGLPKLSVGAPYFNTVFIPIMVPLIFLMAVAPLFHWRNASLHKLRKRLWGMLIVAALFAWVLPLWVGVPFHFMVWMGLALAFWLILNTLGLWWRGTSIRKLPFAQWGMFFAHFGLAIVVIGIVLSSFYSEQANLSLKIGASAHVGPYTFRFASLTPFKGPNYHGVKAVMPVTENGETVATLHPELRLYPIQKIELSKTAISDNIYRDLYVALGRPIGNSSWSVRLYYKPFVRWIWWGGLIMVLGGLFALLYQRRRRKLHA